MKPTMKPSLLRSPFSPIVGIFLTVFLDLISFGMFIPDLQLRGETVAQKMLGSHEGLRGGDPRIGFLVGALLGGFSLAQLVASPYLGRLSDQMGRRKVLIVTTLLSLVSYLMYAHGDSYAVLLGSRIIAGLAAANLGVAFAYVADVSAPEDRAKGFGAVGAALGLGFILGPPLGGFLLKVANDSPQMLGYVGAVLVVVNLAYIILLLPDPEIVHTERMSMMKEIGVAFRSPGLGILLAMFFAFNLGMANLQSTFFLLLADSRSVYHLAADAAKQNGSLILSLVGVVGVIMQGGLVPKLTPKFGEVRLLRFGFICMAPAIALVPFSPLWLPAILVVILLGIGNGLAQPSLSSLVSRSAPKEIQGGIFGVNQALGALARLVGPIISSPLFAYKPSAPYIVGALVILFPTFAAFRLSTPPPAATPPGAVPVE